MKSSSSKPSESGKSGLPVGAGVAFTPAFLVRAARLFGALADPVRLALLRRLLEGEACVRDLVAGAGVKQPTVSKHLGVLEEAGLVRGRRAGGFVIYAVADPVVAELCGLVCASIRRRSEEELRSLTA